MEDEKDIPTENVSSLPKFLQLIEQHYKTNDCALFRGQRNSTWEPIPKFAREEVRARFFMNSTRQEEDILEEFKRLGAPRIINGHTLNDWDLLALAQHHGLPTRLLDWSSNPLVALWFSVNEQPDKRIPAIVWCLNSQPDDFAKTSNYTPFEIPRTLIFRPTHHDARIVAQSGWFTIHKRNIDNGKFSNFRKIVNQHQNLRKILIQPKYFPLIRHQLARCGITHASLFPDLGGLCNHLTWRFLTPKDESDFDIDLVI